MRRAMVVERDEALTRLLTGGLRVFKPGYRVVNAKTLHDATAWVGSEPPDLLVVGLADLTVDDVMSWAVEHRVRPDRIVALADDLGPGSPFAAVLPRHCGLSTFLAVVRGLDFPRPTRGVDVPGVIGQNGRWRQERTG